MPHSLQFSTALQKHFHSGLPEPQPTTCPALGPILAVSILLLVCFFATGKHAAASTTGTVELSAPTELSSFISDVEFYLDPDWSKQLQDFTDGGESLFSPINSPSISFGYTKSKIWIRFTVRDSTQHENEWLLYIRENFLQHIDIHAVRSNGRSESLLSLRRDSPFSARPVAHPEITAPISLASNEQLTIYIAYWSEGFSGLDFSLQTPASFSQLTSQRTAKNYIYYGMMTLMIIAAGLCLIFLRETVFLAYLAYAISTLLYLLHADGVAFQYLWPNLGLFNSYASIVIGGSFALFSATFARVYLQTSKFHPFVDKVLLCVIVSVALVMVVGSLLDPQWTKKTLISMALLSILVCTWSGIVAAFTRFREVRFYVLAWVGAIISSLIMNMRHIFGIDIAQDLEFDSMRIAMVFDALMMGFGIADRYRQMRLANQKSMERNLAFARRQSALDTRLQDLQDQYQLAMELVQTRDAEMIQTVHDIRAPLHALRLNLRQLKNNPDSTENDNSKIDETFTYLENLIAGQLQRSIVEGSAEAGDARSQSAIDEGDALSVPSVLQSIHDMFLPDADEKGLTFRYRHTRHNMALNHFALMRIISNLVSNAIRYTDSGGVLLACRRTGTGLRIEVHDSGHGLCETHFNNAATRSETVSADGHGYGLEIVHNLARKHGFKVYLCNARRNGTGVIVQITGRLSNEKPHRN